MWQLICTLSRIEAETGNQQKAIESARAGVAAATELNNREDSYETAKSLASTLQILSVALPDGQESQLAASRSNDLFEMMLARWPEQSAELTKRMIVSNHINMGQRDSDHAAIPRGD